MLVILKATSFPCFWLTVDECLKVNFNLSLLMYAGGLYQLSCSGVLAPTTKNRCTNVNLMDNTRPRARAELGRGAISRKGQLSSFEGHEIVNISRTMPL